VRLNQLGDTVVEFLKLINGRIVAIERRHPFAVTEADGGQLSLQPPSEGGFPGTDVSVDQVSGWHIAVPTGRHIRMGRMTLW
jgi:hypothetical protein